MKAFLCQILVAHGCVTDRAQIYCIYYGAQLSPISHKSDCNVLKRFLFSPLADVPDFIF